MIDVFIPVWCRKLRPKSKESIESKGLPITRGANKKRGTFEFFRHPLKDDVIVVLFEGEDRKRFEIPILDIVKKLADK